MSTTKNLSPFNEDHSRRKFIHNLTKVAGTAAFLSLPLAGNAGVFFNMKQKDNTVGEIMDLFISQFPGGALSNTVDTLKAGDRDIKVTGIVTTMFATVEVIRKAINLGANFIIAHEPTFYNHLDETAWLADDDVYRYKADLLKQHNIAVWRNHDYIHRLNPDGVRMGVLNQLNWQSYYNPAASSVLMLPATSLKSLIEYLKQKLFISQVRYIGNPEQSCQKILLMPGAAGGTRQIQAMGKEKPDVLICGEIQEWETAEYVRDAQAEGQKLSLIVLGHIASEEPGSEFMATWLNKNVPGIKITHVLANNSLSFL
ncbi:Nif3-like dinuclear metal center hexameric protein [Mucilaginibacter sabulilitoris]|uniref:Nif3-like dinuclear metal center hexameric protein n=1 Tax=Mucilaginibacter sabulilitoris TaxID=1173583 RepID=A0ABZ0TN94_9SPHI|nr:Nif3-like dinuclear metal center hexameric protein [Mucilaginibacter sabulilitoris]WPU92990.1 Nif3-like dinuclear metal center hexameric protein [Mucilaginibacter sabulilitoris]